MWRLGGGVRKKPVKSTGFELEKKFAHHISGLFAVTSAIARQGCGFLVFVFSDSL
jgi:hypothetical protein